MELIIVEPKKIKNPNKKQQFDELMKRGVHITQDAQEGDILYAEDPFKSLHEVFRDYHLWKMDVRDFFLKYWLDDEANFFFEADDVPMLKGGLAYSYADSPESQSLLKNIRKETKDKLAYLRNFKETKLQNVVDEKQQKKGIVKLPKGISLEWEKVELKMKEGMREIEILYNGKHIKTADYVELGFFVGKKQQKPDRQWLFLCALAVLATTDITRATPDNMKDMLSRTIEGNKEISIEGVHQIKRNLLKHLQEIFDEKSKDPFKSDTGYYHPKFKILPETLLRKEELWGSRSIVSNSKNDKPKSNRFKKDFGGIGAE
ncbi:MAG: hypothetical protein ACD_37C00101G0004 [uncultured bacterium]|nr:MAG: hypothetical protein ACD_37C00101G0004 [uncultured bacterium]